MFTRDDSAEKRGETFAFRPVVALVASAIMLSACGGDSAPPATVVDNQNQTTATSESSSSTNNNSSSSNNNTVVEDSNSNDIDRDSTGGSFVDRSNTNRSATSCVNGSVPFRAGEGASDTTVLIANNRDPLANGFYIDTSGGNGGNNGGQGGNGGCVDIFQPGGMAGLRVKDSSHPTIADAAFSPYTPASANLGSNELVISANTTIERLTSEPPQGQAYILRTNRSLFISDGDGAVGDEAPVTGIHVKAGATLTFGLNYGSGDYLRLILKNDVFNEGVITTLDDDEGDRGGIEIVAASLITVAGSEINTYGRSAGQRGGGVDFIVDYSIYNAGTINTYGANSDLGPGGDGGDINLSAQAGLQNTGEIVTTGGEATSKGSGGEGGGVDMKTSAGNALNSAVITTDGGDGVTEGGDGGNIAIRVTGAGAIKNNGDLVGIGGDATNGPAGNGGDIGLYVDGGGIRDTSGTLQVALANTGNITSKGGSTSGDTASGGTAGDVTFEVDYGNLTEAWQPSGHMEISGNIDASGGHATPDGSGRGGDGGLIVVELDAKLHSLDQYLHMLGYDEINASGGSGNSGGDAGMVGMMTQFGDTAAEFLTPSGDVENQAAIFALGGNATPVSGSEKPAAAGAGGDVTLETEYYCGMFDVVFDPILPHIGTMEHTTNTAAIDTSGGKSIGADVANGDGGAAGDVLLWGYNRVENIGSISANGGAGSDEQSSRGGTGGVVSLRTELGQADNSALINANGGNGSQRGGNADMVEILAAGTATNSGAISAVGGDATGTISADTQGGAGGIIKIFSQLGPTAVTANESTVTYEYVGGSGDATGSTGGLAIGGLCTKGEC